VRVDPRTNRRPEPEPWWRHLVRMVGALIAAIFRPIGSMARSERPLDEYGLVQLSASAGDALVAIALAGSVFFEVPVGEAKVKVALYLALTMAPLALAGPVLVPLLDRAGSRRIISFGAAIARALVCVYGAPRVSTLVLFPVAFALLALTKVHAITRNGLVMAYAGSDGLVRANARLGRIAVGGVLLASGPGLLVLKLGDATAVLYVAAVAYGVSALLNLRLPHPQAQHRQAQHRQALLRPPMPKGRPPRARKKARPRRATARSSAPGAIGRRGRPCDGPCHLGRLPNRARKDTWRDFRCNWSWGSAIRAQNTKPTATMRASGSSTSWRDATTAC